MPKDRKRRRSIFDDFFGGSIFDEIEELFEKFSEGFDETSFGMGGGYSIEVTYANGRPIVRAKLSDNIDRAEFEKMLREKYPGAEIIIEGGRGEKFEVVRKEKEGKKVVITLDEGEKEKRVDEKSEESSTGSLFDMMYGKKRVWIKRESVEKED